VEVVFQEAFLDLMQQQMHKQGHLVVADLEVRNNYYKIIYLYEYVKILYNIIKFFNRLKRCCPSPSRKFWIWKIKKLYQILNNNFIDFQ
jgi:hypothetical protein